MHWSTATKQEGKTMKDGLAFSLRGSAVRRIDLLVTATCLILVYIIRRNQRV